MEAGLWGILARRFGAGVFLRSVFPVLLTWVDRGVYGALHRLDDHIVDDNHYRGGGRGSSAQSSGVYQDEGGEFCWPQSSEATVATETEAGSRVQVAAAAAVSCEVYEYLGECHLKRTSTRVSAFDLISPTCLVSPACRFGSFTL